MFQNIKFKDARVRIDGQRFIDCEFENCIFEYSGEMNAPISFERCKIVNYQYRLVGPARNTMRFLESVYHGQGESGIKKVNMVFEAIKDGFHTRIDAENAKKTRELKHGFSLYCSIMHLSTPPDVNIPLIPTPIRLSRNVALLNTWREKNSEVETFFGKLYLDALARNPFFHCQLGLSYDEAAQVKFGVVSTISSYLSALWLIKDHSASINRLFVEGPNLHGSLSGASRDSTSSGEYTDSVFTNAELIVGLDFYNKLRKINPELSSPVESLPVESLPGFDPSFKSGIKSALINETNYDDFNRITRAWLFVLAARGQTHLPPKIAFYMSGLESLFSTSRYGVTAQVCNRAAKYITASETKFENKFKFLNEMYNARSRYLHGDALGTSNTTSALAPKVEELDSLVRTILVKVINDDSILFTDTKKINAYLESLYSKK